MPFNIGDAVSVIKDVTINYADCDIKGIYHIPAGAAGVVISGPNIFGVNDVRIGVRFFDEENYPNLFYNLGFIGPGHYIEEQNLHLYGVIGEFHQKLEIASEQELNSFLFS